jgi:hypothetical protein
MCPSFAIALLSWGPGASILYYLDVTSMNKSTPAVATCRPPQAAPTQQSTCRLCAIISYKMDSHHITRSTFYCVGGGSLDGSDSACDNEATICSAVTWPCTTTARRTTRKTISPTQQSAIQKWEGRDGNEEENDDVCSWTMMVEEQEGEATMTTCT